MKNFDDSELNEIRKKYSSQPGHEVVSELLDALESRRRDTRPTQLHKAALKVLSDAEDSPGISRQLSASLDKLESVSRTFARR